MKLVKMKCDNCGAILKVNEELKKLLVAIVVQILL